MSEFERHQNNALLCIIKNRKRCGTYFLFLFSSLKGGVGSLFFISLGSWRIQKGRTQFVYCHVYSQWMIYFYIRKRFKRKCKWWWKGNRFGWFVKHWFQIVVFINNFSGLSIFLYRFWSGNPLSLVIMTICILLLTPSRGSVLFGIPFTIQSNFIWLLCRFKSGDYDNGINVI